MGKLGFALKTIEVVSLVGQPWGKKIRSLLTICKSLGQSWQLLRSFQPDLVLGMGGYTSGPVVLAAWAMGKRTAIHEQNVIPGLSNKILSKVVDRVFISFPESVHFFPRQKTFCTGNPVRQRFRTPLPLGAGENKGRFTIFLFGGSQGAHRLNKSMAEALTLLNDLREKIHIIHQTGSQDYQQMKEIYGQQGWGAEIYSFLEDIERAYARADLVICRAGASTLFELMAMGKPAILVPFPFAANDHQTLNARTLVKAGAAFLVADREFSGVFLSNLLKKLINDPRPLKEMGKRAASLAKLAAAQNIVEHCYELVRHG